MKTQIRFTAITLMILAASVYFYGCTKSGKEQISGSGSKDQIAATNEGKKYNIQPSEYKLDWKAKKATGQHNGVIDISKGLLYADNGKLTGGEFDIDFNSIKVLDVEDADMNMKLTNHLKSDDFFSAGKFPTGKFVIKSLAPLSNGTQNNYTITGTLTIKGISNDITFPASVKVSNEGVTASADINLDRTQWDIKYRSSKFFENLGDKLISDEFTVKFNITAK